MADASPTKNTPKRKRGEQTQLSPVKFSFEVPTEAVAEDGSDSPRSKVAQKFRGLALDGGGGAASDDNEVADLLMRKRQKPDEVMHDVATFPGVSVLDFRKDSLAPPEENTHRFQSTNEAPPKTSNPVIGLGAKFAAVSRPAEPKPKVRRRPGSPPLRPKKVTIREDAEEDDDMEIADPIRVALTWQEDEITIYDPEDKDDDGTGINGIGFKPTAALAQARTMKRKQQLAEYRKREESEARAKRNQRRRGGSEITISPEQRSPTRKVRFTEAEAEARKSAITTE
ncbi:hypothetical protein G7046_g6487 [Stylonectria norvegica]|nr:hypothetical protein G7046_g6487 [Stylonectria norvegica]